MREASGRKRSIGGGRVGTRVMITRRGCGYRRGRGRRGRARLACVGGRWWSDSRAQVLEPRDTLTQTLTMRTREIIGD